MDEAFPPATDDYGKPTAYPVVGTCPHCGAPVYGPPFVRAGDPPGPVRHSCECRRWIEPPRR